MQIDFILWNRKLVSSVEKQNASICGLNCHFVVFSFTTLLALECVICFTPPWLCLTHFHNNWEASKIKTKLFLAPKSKFIKISNFLFFQSSAHLNLPTYSIMWFQSSLPNLTNLWIWFQISHHLTYLTFYFQFCNDWHVWLQIDFDFFFNDFHVV